MSRSARRTPRFAWFVCTILAWITSISLVVETGWAQQAIADQKSEFTTAIQPLLKRYCLDCHSSTVKKGSLDLERFASVDQIRKDLMPWQQLIEQLEADEMPPKDKPQPTADERKRLVTWTRALLDAVARDRAGDPGLVPLRRLSNTEFDATIRDLTGVNLQPAREFPADGAAGEGFTNAGESLADISPTLLNKYINAAEEIADHAVLLPEGIRFSKTKTRRDWTDESTTRLREFYSRHVGNDGRLPIQGYVAAAVRHRDEILGTAVQKSTPEEIAAGEKLNPKYFAALCKALLAKTSSDPLEAIRNRWQTATMNEVPALTTEISALQTALWKTVRVGSYVRPEDNGTFVESLTRQVAVDPPAVESVPLRLAIKPAPGQTEVVVNLATRDLLPIDGVQVVWQRPRFEAQGKSPLLLRDYAEFGSAFEVDYPSIFVGSAKYLAAAAAVANDGNSSVDDLAKSLGLDSGFLKRWCEVLALETLSKDKNTKTIPAVALSLMQDKAPNNDRPAINGWKKKGSDLPIVVTNSSDEVHQIPGRVSAHGVAVHPLPNEFVAVTWKSPLTANIHVLVRVSHAHPDCGNGVAWWLEHRKGDRATVLGEGMIDLGKEANPPEKALKIQKGETIVLAVDARDGNHSCDLTEIDFIVTSVDAPERVWNLKADVADNITTGNPHADQHGNAETWSFVSGTSKGASADSAANAPIPPDSILGQWRKAAASRQPQDELKKLAAKVETLLSGPRPEKANDSDKALYDRLLSIDGPLFKDLDVARLAKPRPEATNFGLAKSRFGTQAGSKPIDDASLPGAANSVTAIRLPAALFAGREFVVEGRLAEPAGNRVVQFQAGVTPPSGDTGWGTGPVVASRESEGFRKFVQGRTDFRQLFPLYLCFPDVIPNDEVVSLKMFHREDEPLIRLFLNSEQQSQLDHLWNEHAFISRQAIAENNYLPLFIGFVTQDQPKAMLDFFNGQRPAFQKAADELLKKEEAAIRPQLNALLEFASKAYRRPLTDQERTDLVKLYSTIRAREFGHEDAVRRVLARLLVSPAFLFRIEQAPAGKEAQPVNDFELATRLSYFLWSSVPDQDLRNLAASGQLHQPQVLEHQVRRMLKDERLRALAVEFGTQWIHVRGFDEFKEKNETLFPTFNSDFRKIVYEESILFFQDLFQNDRAVTQILDADYAFLNEPLAKHYGIPGVTSPQWRRVDGVQKFGRGGVLGLASVQAKQSGASRTSPVLRGNWVVETLLGEKLPRPPADVPRLPEEEGDGGLTMRQQVEKHAKQASCATCHVRIDPFGFALESYDSIGRLREKVAGGPDFDVKAKLKDGTEFEGMDGLRTYLLTKKKDVVVRLFCRRLLGYALGRAVTLSDTALLDQIVADMNKNEGRVSSIVLTIVGSPQFRMIRGSDYSE